MEAETTKASITSGESAVTPNARRSKGQAADSKLPEISPRVRAKATAQSDSPDDYLQAMQQLTRAMQQYGAMKLTAKTIWHEGRAFVRVVVADGIICQKCQKWQAGSKCQNPDCDLYGLPQPM